MTTRSVRLTLPELMTAMLAAAFVALGHASPAAANGHEPEGVTSGNGNIKLSVSGQVNRGVLYVDDGADEQFFHVDNDNSSTRVRFVGSGSFSDDISVGTVVEVQFESNSTANIKMNQDSATGDDNFTQRKLELYFDHKRYGRLWLGQGDTASNGTSEVDLSGTGVIGYSGVADMAGGIEFQDTGGTGPSIGSTFSNMDGLSRDDRLRYDTPNLGGFKLSGSLIENGAADVALRYNAAFGGFELVSALAYSSNSGRDKGPGDLGFSQINGSVSVHHDSGFNVTAAAGRRDLDDLARDEDPFFWYAKAGYKWGGGIGGTAIAFDYMQADDIDEDNDEGVSYSVMLVQKIDKIATDLYLGGRIYQLDRTDRNFDDVAAVMAGARVKF